MGLLRLRVSALLLGLVLAACGVYAAGQSLYAPEPVHDRRPRVAAPLRVPAPEVAGLVSAPVTDDGDSLDGVPVVSGRWLRRTAERAALPVAALRAYARAELEAPSGCGVGWPTLAGIGRVESVHGTIGGRTLGPDGVSSRRIVGPALDGGPGVRAIRATPASTALHGDPRWDHAVGPMQFLTATWATWAADADGDGARDPHDLDDAALGAARYLCAGGRDLATGAGWSDAVLSYNRSGDYLRAVHDAAQGYARAAAR